MQRLSTITFFSVSLFLVVVTSCNDDNNGNDGNDGNNSNDATEIGATAFESANPYLGEGSGDRAGSDSDTDADVDMDDASATDDGSYSAQRAIEEADIIKVVGNTLYALSQYRGLVIVDISDSSDLQIIGTHNAMGEPFEMYVRDNIVLPIYSSYWQYTFDEETFEFQSTSSSRILALNISDPTQIKEVATFDMPGYISDSRMVGDVLYAVTYENGYCWRCANEQQSVVTSLNISNLNNIEQVDQIAFKEDGYGGWRRSIEVTTDRLYVSGTNYTDDWERANSNIQVVDISNPTGVMTAGATIEVAGQIESRWQMNEYDGILRVISQPGTWNSNMAPVVETFQINSTSDVSALGSMNMELPRPESLMSVRFDGTRAYAVTFEQTDPLFVIDLTDPAIPVQQGELEIPGWLYHMEPRGDKLFAIGFDNTAESNLSVSLFDVSDGTNPTMIDRVHFGPKWGGMPEDQDRIHKAFRILDDEGLILMPFYGWARDSNGYSSNYYSGVQLIDFTADELRLRGVAPHVGQARRAFLHNGDLLAMSDDRVDAYDISDKDNPELLSQVKMSRVVYHTAPAGDYVAELVGNWWTNEASLELYDKNAPDATEPVGSLSLKELVEDESRAYYYWYYGFNFASAQIFNDGDYLHLMWYEDPYYYEEYGASAKYQPQTGVVTIDISDPVHPTLVHQSRFGFVLPYSKYDYYSGAYYGVTAGQRYIQKGSRFVIKSNYDYWSDQDATVYVLDLSDPVNPQLSDAIQLPGDGQAPIMIDAGEVVAFSHFQAIDDNARKVRFYLDRLDISDLNNPKWLAPINIPGTAVAYDHASGQLLTIDYKGQYKKVNDWDACYLSEYSANRSYNYDTGLCSIISYDLMYLTIDNTGDSEIATLRDIVDWEDTPIDAVLGSTESLFVGTNALNYYWTEDMDGETATDPRPSLIQYQIAADATIAQVSQWKFPTMWSQISDVTDDTALISAWGGPHLFACSSQDGQQTDCETYPLSGYSYDAYIADDIIISANGQHGVQTFQIK